jgi:predicted nucleic-acid-binding Zn-ribbon protein
MSEEKIVFIPAAFFVLTCRKCGLSWVAAYSESVLDWMKVVENNKECPKCNSKEINLRLIPYTALRAPSA